MVVLSDILALKPQTEHFELDLLKSVGGDSIPKAWLSVRVGLD